VQKAIIEKAIMNSPPAPERRAHLLQEQALDAALRATTLDEVATLTHRP
jgi:hypothetical protein